MVRLIQQTTDQFAAAYSYFCLCPVRPLITIMNFSKMYIIYLLQVYL